MSGEKSRSSRTRWWLMVVSAPLGIWAVNTASGARSRKALATPVTRLVAPGPSVETHTPATPLIWPITWAIVAALDSWPARTNRRSWRRQASIRARTSPPGSPKTNSTPHPANASAIASAWLAMRDSTNRVGLRGIHLPNQEQVAKHAHHQYHQDRHHRSFIAAGLLQEPAGEDRSDDSGEATGQF